MKKNRKSAYICGPLTELSGSKRTRIKAFFESTADLFEEITGVRAFVPHEHYDPVSNANFTPQEVDRAERTQISKNTSILIVVAIAPSWGGGIEVEMANQSNVPVIILCDKKKLEKKKISRLLRGNPAIKDIIAYTSLKNALAQLRKRLQNIAAAKNW